MGAAESAVRCRWRGRALVALAALTFGGCVLAPHFERPELAVAGVELDGAQLLAQRFRVRVRVTNPNDRELPVQAIHFTVDLDGERFGDGATEAPFTVPAHGAGEFATIVHTDLASALVRLLPKFKDGAPVGYHLVGVVETKLPFLSSVPFDERGSFTLK